MSAETSQATLRDAAEMAPHMRREDADEVWAEARMAPYEALVWSLGLSGSDAWTVRVRGKIMAMWGVVPVNLLGGEVVPWLLTTYEVERHPREFMRAARAAVNDLKKFRLAHNRVDARYEKALRWAGRIGFEVGPQLEEHGYKFHEITLRRL